jgi:hypothetical protein
MAQRLGGAQAAVYDLFGSNRRFPDGSSARHRREPGRDDGLHVAAGAVPLGDSPLHGILGNPRARTDYRPAI